MAVNRFLSEGAIGQNISVQLEGATKCRVVGKGDAVLLAPGGACTHLVKSWHKLQL